MLRPCNTDGTVKDPKDYTIGEREAVIIEIENASRGRAAGPEAVAFAHRLRDEYKGEGKVLGGRDLDINTQAVTPSKGAADLLSSRKN